MRLAEDRVDRSGAVAGDVGEELVGCGEGDVLEKKLGDSSNRILKERETGEDRETQRKKIKEDVKDAPSSQKNVKCSVEYQNSESVKRQMISDTY